MIRRIIAAAAAAVMTLCLVSCAEDAEVRAQTEQTVITLSWWGNDSRNEYTIEAVSRFEALHPEIKVKCSYSEWSGYEARSRVQMVSGTEADVMQINVGWLSQYSADGNGYYDLEKLSGLIDLSNFSEDILKYGRRNGKLNAIPIAMNAETVYINKTLYERCGLGIPKTWDDLFAAAKVMSKDGIYPMSGAAKSLWLYCIAYTEQLTGKRILTDSSKINFDRSDLETMIGFYCRMVNEKVIPKVEDFQRYNLENLTYAGVVAWVSDAMNYFSGVIEAGSEIIANDYTAFSSDRAGEGWYAKPATLYAMSKSTEHPQEAALLLDFMLNSSEWAELQGVEKGIPLSAAVRSHLEETGVLTGIQYEAAQVMEKNGLISEMNSILEDSNLYNSFIDCCDLVLFDKASLEEAAGELYTKFSESYGTV